MTWIISARDMAGVLVLGLILLGVVGTLLFVGACYLYDLARSIRRKVSGWVRTWRRSATKAEAEKG